MTEKIGIVYDVLVDSQSYKDTAFKYRVSTSVVARLLWLSKKNPDMLKELIYKDDEKELKQQLVKDTTLAQLNHTGIINNATEI